MSSPVDRDGEKPPEGDLAPSADNLSAPPEPPADSAAPSAGVQPGEESAPVYDPPHDYYDDPYAHEPTPAPVTDLAPVPAAPAPPATPPPPTSSTPPEEEEEDEEDHGMLRMSFLEHLEELRHRLIMMLAGMGVAFAASLFFAERLWLIVQEPAVEAMKRIGYTTTTLAQISPMDTFSIVYVKLPLLTSIFLASPWLLYQVWAFIAPGLYKRERRWAIPFVLCSAGLFIAGGLFAYFVAFRFGLEFLLRIGFDINIQPYLSITEYFDLFVNVVLGIGIVFELPVLIFFLSLVRVVTPSFLIRNTRYAVLGIVVLAAIITPTPDVINLVLFSAPMILLYFMGVFASYLLFLHRENQRFPWGKVLFAVGAAALLIALGAYMATTRYGYRLVPNWPFFVR